MRISDDTKKEILEKAGQNIVQLIGEVIPLTKTGTTYKACCPFHNEKTPSFTVTPSRGTWHCFGQCNDGGDVAKFFMIRDNIKFPEALTFLAGRLGITIPQGESKEDKERKAMLHALSKAQFFFRQTLSTNPNNCLEYVLSRFSPYETGEYGIGYAPNGGRALVDYLDKSGVPLWAAEKAGVIRKKENEPYQDVFWGRVMIPIRDEKGRVIAFAGRRTDESKTPKYVNSPESDLYKKSATLYGIDIAKQAILDAGEANVVEGYTDCIGMHSAGILNTVATCGTAFTKEHAAYLRRYCKKVNFMFDGDSAGRKATHRAILLALKEDLAVNVYLLPEEHDPDSFFRSGGSYNDIESITGLDFLYFTMKETGIEMSLTHQKLHRLELLERGIFFMAERIPEVRLTLAKRGNLEELFDPELLPAIQEIISKPASFQRSAQRTVETLNRIKVCLENGSYTEPSVRSEMLRDINEALG